MTEQSTPNHMGNVSQKQNMSNFKLYFILLFVAVLVIGLCIFGIYYLDATAQTTMQDFAAIEAAVYFDDWQTAGQLLDNSYQYWNSHKSIWQTFLDHKEIDDIESSFLSTMGYIKSHSYEDVMSSMNLLQYNIMHVPSTQKITLSNIL